MEIIEVPINEIHSDPEFNCRGEIAPIDVAELLRDIEKNGLQTPITIRIYDEAKQRATGLKYVIVAGHCRHKCYKILDMNKLYSSTATDPLLRGKFSKIACHNLGTITDRRARILNLSENLKRTDLNMLQEAKAIKALKDAGMVQEDVASELGKSRSWVQVRFNLLDLPEAIQQEAASGLLSQYQIKELYGLKDTEKQFAAVKAIKERALKGEKTKDLKFKKPKPEDLLKRRARKPVEMERMIEEIGGKVEYCFATRTLAWAAGNISTMELLLDLRDYARAKGVNYTIPDPEAFTTQEIATDVKNVANTGYEYPT